MHFWFYSDVKILELLFLPRINTIDFNCIFRRNAFLWYYQYLCLPIIQTESQRFLSSTTVWNICSRFLLTCCCQDNVISVACVNYIMTTNWPLAYLLYISLLTLNIVHTNLRIVHTLVWHPSWCTEVFLKRLLLVQLLFAASIPDKCRNK